MKRPVSALSVHPQFITNAGAFALSGAPSLPCHGGVRNRTGVFKHSMEHSAHVATLPARGIFRVWQSRQSGQSPHIHLQLCTKPAYNAHFRGKQGHFQSLFVQRHYRPVHYEDRRWNTAAKHMRQHSRRSPASCSEGAHLLLRITHVPLHCSLLSRY